MIRYSFIESFCKKIISNLENHELFKTRAEIATNRFSENYNRLINQKTDKQLKNRFCLKFDYPEITAISTLDDITNPFGILKDVDRKKSNYFSIAKMATHDKFDSQNYQLLLKNLENHQTTLEENKNKINKLYDKNPKNESFLVCKLKSLGKTVVEPRNKGSGIYVKEGVLLTQVDIYYLKNVRILLH